jgi:hypothetical protein
MHPIWTARSGMLLFLTGLTMLMLVGPVGTIVAVIFYGAGNGIMTIARGTLPLALFGAQGYGVRLGRLARPAVFAQALAPVAFASLLERAGPTVALSCTLGLAAIAFVAFGFLRREAPES